ncbi:MAG: RES family NAD+ phosphorylase [Lautropia sp.]
MKVWRIATASPDYHADDLSGEGARRVGGRWNHPGVPIVYAASSRALAVLETVVHLGAASLPQNRYIIEIDIPETVWNQRNHHDQQSILRTVPSWDAVPAAGQSMTFGSVWVQSRAKAVMTAPSVIVPVEFVVLINPGLVTTSGITASIDSKYRYEIAMPRSR